METPKKRGSTWLLQLSKHKVTFSDDETRKKFVLLRRIHRWDGEVIHSKAVEARANLDMKAPYAYVKNCFKFDAKHV
jgi:hypothetical protein